MTTITPAQQRVLDFVRAFIREKGFPPTRSEISAAMGYSSANAADQTLRYLAKKGAIELAPNISRGIRILGDAA